MLGLSRQQTLWTRQVAVEGCLKDFCRRKFSAFLPWRSGRSAKALAFSPILASQPLAL